MNPAEFQELFDLLRDQLRDVGADDVLNSISGAEEDTLRDPKQRLIELLSTFEHSLALADRSTFNHVMSDLRELPSEGRPSAVVATTDPDEARRFDRGETFNFAELPDLAELRKQLRGLVDTLAKTPYDPRTGRV